MNVLNLQTDDSGSIAVILTRKDGIYSIGFAVVPSYDMSQILILDTPETYEEAVYLFAEARSWMTSGIPMDIFLNDITETANEFEIHERLAESYQAYLDAGAHQENEALERKGQKVMEALPMFGMF